MINRDKNKRANNNNNNDCVNKLNCKNNNNNNKQQHKQLINNSQPKNQIKTNNMNPIQQKLVIFRVKNKMFAFYQPVSMNKEKITKNSFLSFA